MDLNATQAAIRAGYSEKTANEQGARLLANVSVQQAIQRAMQKRSDRLEITQDRVIQELASIAFSDATAVARIVDDGTRVELTDTDRLTADQRAAIAGIKEGKFGIEVRMHDKLGALVKLGEHLGMFRGDSGDAGDGVQIIDDV